jgi:hypothetical protein
MISKSHTNGIEILTIESNHLTFSIAPALGGKILSIYNTDLEKEFLWINDLLPLEINRRGADYDSNFIGAIDELVPNDVPETIDGISYPDHGELWTTALQYDYDDNQVNVHGKLQLSGLHYTKTVYPEQNAPVLYLDYKIKNETNAERNLLWKLHAALQIEAGDRLITNAKFGQVVDPVYSRFTQLDPFFWPSIEDTDASIVPAKSDTVDFFYLYEVPDCEMLLLSNEEKHLFSYRYDPAVFPYQWYFASYGGFLGHYTAILEPCTNMPMSVNEAKAKGQCMVLKPGEELNTTVRIYAGERNKYIP